jgi:hypothetical protein
MRRTPSSKNPGASKCQCGWRWPENALVLQKALVLPKALLLQEALALQKAF